MKKELALVKDALFSKNKKSPAVDANALLREVFCLNVQVWW